jgi:hypothetical protein
MATFLFIAASVAMLAGLVGLVAGSMPRTAKRPQGPCTTAEPCSPGAD